MDPESIEVVPSADNGNVPAEEIAPVAPSEPAEAVVPAEKETVTPAEPVVELFELPDGRKVDAATLTKEWKDNFLPDYTRKSQALAAKETSTLPTEKPKNPYADPAYVPESYDEILNVATERALRAIESKEQERVEAQKALQTAVETQLAEVRQIDPQFNENSLFQHAVKYGFRDLKLAHQNMKDMASVVKTTKQQTAADIAKRQDPVSVSPGAIGAKPDPSQFSTAQEYLRALGK